MINTILAAFDSDISSKCYIEKYGRLAVTVRQSVSGTPKRYPVSCALIDDCENLQENHNELLPDDAKKGVAFWKQVQPITYGKPLEVSHARNLKAAETVLDLVVWVNLKKVSGQSLPTNWCTLPELALLDMLKTLDCKKEVIPSGVEYIRNLRLEVVSVGNIVTWKAAMNEYTIDNIDILTLWPFTGFTIRVKLSFHINASCIPAFDCFNCDDAITVTATPETENMCIGGSVDITAVVAGSTGANYQWQELINDEWVDIGGATDEVYSAEYGGPESLHTFRVNVSTCEGCTATSDAAVVIFHDQPLVYITPESLIITIEQTSTIFSEVVGGYGGNSYQWQQLVNGVWTNIALFATGPEYTVDGSKFALGQYQFRLVVTQELNCAAVSDPVTIEVAGLP